LFLGDEMKPSSPDRDHKRKKNRKNRFITNLKRFPSLLGSLFFGDLIRPVSTTARLGKHLSLAGSIGSVSSLLPLASLIGSFPAFIICGLGFFAGCRFYVLFSAKEIEWDKVARKIEKSGIRKKLKSVDSDRNHDES